MMIIIIIIFIIIIIIIIIISSLSKNEGLGGSIIGLGNKFPDAMFFLCWFWVWNM